MSSVLLSFDIEEFDLPRERGGKITLKEGIKVSKSGLLKILDILDKEKVKATFFCTVNFATSEPALIQKMQSSGHEIACHGVDHFSPQPSDLENSKKALEKIIKGKVAGYRQPRMQKINYQEMRRLGYLYDSSINPAFIPGRYNHLRAPRAPYKQQGIVELPVSAPFRIPLFWLSLHLFPEWLYFLLVKSAMKSTGFFTAYFHPWEFADLSSFSVVPGYIKYNSGDKLAARLTRLIRRLKSKNHTFETYSDYLRRTHRI